LKSGEFLFFPKHSARPRIEALLRQFIVRVYKRIFFMTEVLGGFMSKKRSIALLALLFLSVSLARPERSLAQEKELTVADVISRHIASIGSPELLNKVKSRGIIGKAAFKIIAGGTGENMGGQFTYLSEGKNLALLMKFNDINYPGEHFAYNGKEVTVKEMTPGHKSPLADFIFRFNGIVKQGYLGGALSLSWPLLNKTEGLAQEFTYKHERIKDEDYHVLERKLGDLKIRFFFDDKKFHHVRTEYKVDFKNDISSLRNVRGESATAADTSAGMGSSIQKVAETAPRATIQEDQPSSYFTLVEKFDTYIDVRGLSLPSVYGIEYTMEGHGTSFIGEWSVVGETWLANGAKVDQNFFLVK
jgi:hypothetical protein